MFSGGLGSMGLSLDSMILKTFSNPNDFMILLYHDSVTYLIATGRGIQGARMCITWAGVQKWQVYNPTWLEVWWVPAASCKLIKDWDVCQPKWEITDYWTQQSVLKEEGNKDLFNSGWISKWSSGLRDIPDCIRVDHIKYRKLSDMGLGTVVEVQNIQMCYLWYA